MGRVPLLHVMVESETTHDRVLTDHETVKRWVRQRGGRPVARSAAGTERLDLEFPGEDAEDASPMDWSEFFAHFEVQGLALACTDESGPTGSGIEYALVDRDEADVEAGADGDGSESKAEARDVPPERDREEEGEAEERYHEAASEANVDAHRDEPPFQS